MARRPAELFRERALERANRAESFDEHIRVVGAPRWLALVFGLLVIGGFVAWVVSREVETTVEAGGILSAPGLEFVAAPANGLVVQAPPAGGTDVSAGDVIAKIDPEGGPNVSVRTFASGTVGAVSARKGSVVELGDQLAAIEPTSQTVNAVLFVPLTEAAGIEPGLDALLTPLAGASEASSQLRGTVQAVSSSPATPGRLELVLGPTLASEMAAGPPVVEVDVTLVPDPSTPSGYAWTSGDGSPGPLSPATPVSARIVLEQKSPLHFLF